MTTEQYPRLIASLVAGARPFAPTVETATAVQVERGTALAGTTAEPLPPVRATVIDASGHRRPHYRPLMAYACAVADVGGVRPWLASLSVDADVEFGAANGAQAAAAAWGALALAVTGDGEPARRLFARLVTAQQASGALLRTTAADNPETHWYHELVILHAMADYAVRSSDAAAWRAVERATMFHLNETETDHATGQPWGLPAFVRVAGAEPLADGALHAVSAHQPRGASGVALLLLADTLYGLRNAPGRVASENVSR
jgi:hypothetical protein